LDIFKDFCGMKRFIFSPAIALAKAGLAFLLILAPMITEAQISYTPLRQPLNTGQWEFRQANTPSLETGQNPGERTHRACCKMG
jgi:hypothetical protein